MQRFRFPEVAPGTLYVRPSRRILGAEFGRDELRHVAFGAAVLALIFAAAFARGSLGLSIAGFFTAFAFFLPVAAAAAVPPFFLGMVAQKRVAAKEGCTTEFRILPQWLVISVLFAFLFGFVFAAPGATVRFGNVTRAGAGKMSAAVPLCYLGVGFGALLAFVSVGLAAGFAVALYLSLLARVCGILAAFAMIPIPGFAGGDIWRWSKPYFAVILAAGVALYWSAGIV